MGFGAAEGLHEGVGVEMVVGNVSEPAAGDAFAGLSSGVDADPGVSIALIEGVENLIPSSLVPLSVLHELRSDRDLGKKGDAEGVLEAAGKHTGFIGVFPDRAAEHVLSNGRLEKETLVLTKFYEFDGFIGILEEHALDQSGLGRSRGRLDVGLRRALTSCHVRASLAKVKRDKDAFILRGEKEDCQQGRSI